MTRINFEIPAQKESSDKTINVQASLKVWQDGRLDVVFKHPQHAPTGIHAICIFPDGHIALNKTCPVQLQDMGFQLVNNAIKTELF